MELTVVSLFSGCGGSDIGLAQAGATVIFANDINRDAAETYRAYQSRFAADADMHHKDIRDIASFPDGDVIVGCYPCQSFSMGGRRSPADDKRTDLFREFHRALRLVRPRYFIVENVPGMAWLSGGSYLREQLDVFRATEPGYRVSCQLLNARDYGLPADRRRIFIVGVRKDQEGWYHFPEPTHGPGRKPYESHGDAIASLPVDGWGDYYDRAAEPFSWWYLSRNRKRSWAEPSFTVQANWRHVALHPASPAMVLVESDLANKSRQRWEFSQVWEHLEGHAERPKLEQPRRLTWRECARLQDLPDEFEPVGTIQSKFAQIGNAVPPLMMESVARGLVTGVAIESTPPDSGSIASPDNAVKQWVP